VALGVLTHSSQNSVLEEIEKFVNTQRRGVGGRPLVLLECQVTQDKKLSDCADEFAQKDVYAIVATDDGVGTLSALEELAQTTPVVVANPVGVSVLVSQGVTAITPGMPGLMLSLAIMATDQLTGENKSISVVHSGSEQSNSIFASIVRPVLVKSGVRVENISEVVVPDGATSDEVVELLTDAGITSSAVIADVAGNSCSGFTNWVNSLTTQPVVLAVDACALSNSKRETENWFVARYGNDFTNVRDSEFGKRSWVSSYREGIRAAVLAVVDLLNERTERNLSVAEVKAGFNASIENIRGFSQAPQCALVLSYVALCTTQVGLSQVKNGELIDVRGGTTGNPIELFTEIQPSGS
jgi:hypothetical protein